MINDDIDITYASDEKIDFDKLMNVIHMDKDGTAFQILDKKDILKSVFPFIEELKIIGKCRYHAEDAFTHMNMVYKIFKKVEYGKIEVKNFKTEDFNIKIQKYELYDILALAAFVHDIGKFKSYKSENGKVSFTDHEIIGEKIIIDVLQSFNVCKEVEQLISSVVRAHMYPLKLFKVRTEADKYSRILKEFKSDYGKYINYILIVSFCDIWATSIYYDPENEAEKYKKFIEGLLEKSKRGEF